MKIGIVSQSYYPRYGGVTEHVHHTAVELRKMGHEVRIITSQFRNNAETNHSFGVDRVGYNILIPFNRAFVDVAVGMRLRHQLRALFREHDFDLLHVHCPTAPTLPIFAIQAATCPVVGTFHTTSGRSFLQDAFHGLLKRVIGKLDARIAVSKTAEQSAHMYYPGDYHVIPNGVDIERFDTDAKPFDEWKTNDTTNVLFVGRLDPRKGVQRLIDAMPRVVERSGGKVKLLVIGDSYLRPKFEASVAPVARNHVHFLGHVPSTDLPRWYATGDIFVSPASGNESFGIVLLEAMAAGCPVVASDIPGYRSVIEPGVNGLMVPPQDDEALADTLVELAANPDERKRLSERGRARALGFAWPSVTGRIETVYREALTRTSTVTSSA